MSQAAHTVNLNKQTFDLLKRVQQELGTTMGFEPTFGQVIRHLIMSYYKEE
jgi:hypothetical protein